MEWLLCEDQVLQGAGLCCESELAEGVEASVDDWPR